MSPRSASLFIIPLLLIQSAFALDPCQRTWTRIFGSSGFDYFGGVAFASTGTIYAAGRSNSAFDGNTNAGFSDVYLSRYTRDGVRTWTRMWGTFEQDDASDVAADQSGNAYVFGDTPEAFHGQTIEGEVDIFLTKVDATGGFVWTRFRGSEDYDWSTAISMGTGNLVFCSGYTSGSFDGQTNTGPGLFDAMLCAFSAEGTHLWTRIWGSTASDYVRGMTVSPQGAVYVTGYTTGAFDGLVNSGSNDAFLSKFDAAGNREWSRLWGSYADDYATGVAAGHDGTLYVCGYTLAGFDGQTNAGSYDAFLSKFTASGDRLWSRNWGGPRSEFASDATLRPDGTIFVSGDTYGAFDGQTNSGGRDAFLTVLTTNGDRLASCIWGSRYSDQAVALALSPAGEVALLGHTYGAFDCQTNNGSPDVFISTFLNVAPPVIVITTAPFWVELPFDTASIAGTNSSGIVAGGMMWWENASTAGVYGSFAAPASRAWSIADIPLALGTNVIAVTASNQFNMCVGDTVTVLLEVPEPFIGALAMALLPWARSRRPV